MGVLSDKDTTLIRFQNLLIGGLQFILCIDKTAGVSFVPILNNICCDILKLTTEEFKALHERYISERQLPLAKKGSFNSDYSQSPTNLNKSYEQNDILKSIEKLMSKNNLTPEEGTTRKMSVKKKKEEAKLKDNMHDKECQVEIISEMNNEIRELMSQNKQNSHAGDQLGGKGESSDKEHSSSRSDDSDDIMDDAEFENFTKLRRKSREGTISHVFNIEDIFSAKYKKEIEKLKARNDDLEQENHFLKESEDFLEAELNKLRQSMSDCLREIRKSQDKQSVPTNAISNVFSLSNKEKDNQIQELKQHSDLLKRQLEEVTKKMMDYRTENTDLQYKLKLLKSKAK